MDSPTLAELLARRGPKGLQTGGIEELRNLLDRYPADSYETALDALGLQSGDPRDDIGRRLKNIVSNYILFRLGELRPSERELSDDFRAIVLAARSLLDAMNGLAFQAREALESELILSDIYSLGSVETVAGALVAAGDRAIDQLAPSLKGQPRKDALLRYTIELAEVFKLGTGRKPTRIVETVEFNRFGQVQPLEVGQFRLFANVVMSPLGASISDDMAKRALSLRGANQMDI